MTGARYGELGRLTVADFNPDVGTVASRQSKSGNPRHVMLTDEGKTFFRQLTAGRPGDEPMLPRADGSAWRKSHQNLPMAAAVTRAKIAPPIGFHGLRHTWASHAVMKGFRSLSGPCRYFTMQFCFCQIARIPKRPLLRGVRPRNGIPVQATIDIVGRPTHDSTLCIESRQRPCQQTIPTAKAANDDFGRSTTRHRMAGSDSLRHAKPNEQNAIRPGQI